MYVINLPHSVQYTSDLSDIIIVDTIITYGIRVYGGLVRIIGYIGGWFFFIDIKFYGFFTIIIASYLVATVVYLTYIIYPPLNFLFQPSILDQEVPGRISYR